jgi:replicative DNA helicase
MDMTLNLQVLRMLKTRKRYDRYHNMVPEGTVNETTKKLLRRFGEFFAQVPNAEAIQHAEFWPWFRAHYPTWKDKDIAYWDAAIRPLDGENPAGLDDSIIRNLLAQRLASVSLEFIEKWQEGGEIELAESLRLATEDFDNAVARKTKAEAVELGWDDMVEEEQNLHGFEWRLECLRAHLRSLLAGDFGIIAMRPDRGKTTLIAAEVGYMAPQALALYPDDFRPVLWLNNEGPGRRILGRIRHSVLNLSAQELRDMGPEAAKEAYIEAVGGREDIIQVVDIHGWTNWEVEELIRKKRPSLVVFDMIDNIQFAGKTMNHGERTDQVLEAMYQWARSLGVKYEFAGIASSQISADGEGLQYPAQSNLKDSRTGKQGACDFIITGGFDPNMPNTRFIGTTKNKLKMEGMPSSPQCQVFFDQDRGRFNEAKIVD